MIEKEIHERKQMRLFVFDERSGDPREWLSHGGPTVVIAESAEDAMKRWSHLGSSVQEVLLENPAVIHVQPDAVDRL